MSRKPIARPMTAGSPACRRTISRSWRTEPSPRAWQSRLPGAPSQKREMGMGARTHIIGALAGAGLVLISFAAMAAPAAPLNNFHKSFDATLTRHGIVGGAFGFEHDADKPTDFFFGEARGDVHQKVDAGTAYNWASITKTFTAIAILQ